MADKFVATTKIRKGESSEKSVSPVKLESKTVASYKEGETVNRSDFTDEEWESMVAGGSVVQATAEEVLSSKPLTKTADLQALAQGRHRGNTTFPEQKDDPAELDKRANEQAKAEKRAREDVSLDSATLAEIGKLPVNEQANARFMAEQNAIAAALGTDSDSKKTSKASKSGSDSGSA